MCLLFHHFGLLHRKCVKDTEGEVAKATIQRQTQDIQIEVFQAANLCCCAIVLLLYISVFADAVFAKKVIHLVIST